MKITATSTKCTSHPQKCSCVGLLGPLKYCVVLHACDRELRDMTDTTSNEIDSMISALHLSPLPTVDL
eukprot:scaffold261658_cov15-Prasinocladus_malaysianus.AAC.1